MDENIKSLTLFFGYENIMPMKQKHEKITKRNQKEEEEKCR